MEPIATFLLGDTDAPSAVEVWDATERQVLRNAANVLLGKELCGRSIERVETGYGAVVIVAGDSTDSTASHVWVIGLDEWKFRIHAGAPTPEAGRAPVQFHAGKIATASRSVFRTFYGHVISTAQTKHGDQRSAQNAGGGHQKTPAFIDAVAREAVRLVNAGVRELTKEYKPDLKPRGGTTDVGRHTGGEARDTAAPLAKCALHFLLVNSNLRLDDASATFDLATARFELHRARGLLKQLTANDASAARSTATGTLTKSSLAGSVNIGVDDVYLAMFGAARTGAALASSQRKDLRAFMRDVESIRADLDHLVKAKAQRCADQYTFNFPSMDTLAALPSPHLELDDALDTSEQPISTETSRQHAEKNLGYFPHLPNGSTFASACGWCLSLLSCAKSHGVSLMHSHAAILLDIERLILSKANELPVSATVDNGPLLTFAEVMHLSTLKNAYCKASDTLRSDAHARGSIMVTDLYSRKVLVVWCVLALTQQEAKHAHVELKDYAIAADYQRLGHLVITDASALATLHHLSACAIHLKARRALHFLG